MVESLALALTMCGSTFVYLASPNQRWLSAKPPQRLFMVAGGVLLIAGLAAWIATLRPLAGFFVTLHAAMVCLFAFPYVAALCGVVRQNRHAQRRSS